MKKTKPGDLYNKYKKKKLDFYGAGRGVRNVTQTVARPIKRAVNVIKDDVSDFKSGLSGQSRLQNVAGKIGRGIGRMKVKQKAKKKKNKFGFGAIKNFFGVGRKPQNAIPKFQGRMSQMKQMIDEV